MDSTDVPVLPCLNNDIGNPHHHTRQPCDQFYSTVHVRSLRHVAKPSTDKNNQNIAVLHLHLRSIQNPEQHHLEAKDYPMSQVQIIQNS